MLRNRMLRAAGAAGGEQVISVVVSSGSALLGYKLSPVDGWVGTYAAPSVAPASYEGVKLSPNADFIIVGTDIYEWSRAAGFGSKYSAPPTPVTGTTSIRFQPAVKDIGGGEYLVSFSSSDPPYIWVYRFDPASGFVGSIFGSPGSYDGASIFGADFFPGATTPHILLASNGSVSGKRISVYPWSFGLENPISGSPSPSEQYNPKWSIDGGHIIYHDNGSLKSYSWTGSGYGALVSSTSGIFIPQGHAPIAVHPDGDVVFSTGGATGSSRAVHAWPYVSGAFGAFVSPPSFSLLNGRSVAVPLSGDCVVGTHNSGSYLSAWHWNGSWSTYHGAPSGHSSLYDQLTVA